MYLHKIKDNIPELSQNIPPAVRALNLYLNITFHFSTGSSDASGIVGYQVVAEEPLESESHGKSPTSTHVELGGQGNSATNGGDLDTGQDDLDTGQHQLQTVDSSHDGVIIPGV